jgi:hypothetical protein
VLPARPPLAAAPPPVAPFAPPVAGDGVPPVPALAPPVAPGAPPVPGVVPPPLLPPQAAVASRVLETIHRRQVRDDE